jgi:hypothetical protein
MGKNDNSSKNSPEYLAMKQKLVKLSHWDFMTFVEDWIEENDSDPWDIANTISFLVSAGGRDQVEGLGILEQAKLEFIQYCDCLRKEMAKDEYDDVCIECRQKEEEEARKKDNNIPLSNNVN